ncbi:[SSU ribosomal protein S18P]-alanine acetyltransferase [Mesocricetibacter intestinalis]|uniref:[Ribosomal protein bS18]-alanine N-acetyltransferase n=1 Tax=Mesocricetibacter intestinalis TaxID=1521930 RepID=A0A4R6VGE5_9PAST|nr:ribosomal protein S18-alanine N-acetyltransferase [Mesocricetibacter intestinalis]TDQ59889.1 [SSU ribosomal protein S18P]-alanine acetyltransferase [Mesocricetibacter intestinalis]
MPTTIDFLHPQDFSRLLEIERSAHQVPWSEGTLKNNQGNAYLNLKMLCGERIIGFAICHTVLDEATLFNIAIDPAYQGRGFGLSLLTDLIRRLGERGIATLWLEVRESNKAALALYHKLGFNEVERRKNYYPTADGGRENAIVMASYL